MAGYDERIQHGPREIVLVSVKVPDGPSNCLPVEWHMSCGYNPQQYMIAISKRRFSHGLLMAADWFGVNFLRSADAELARVYGSCSGVDGNKLTIMEGVEWSDTSVCPLLKGSPCVMVCRKISSMTVGSHTIFVGEVRRTDYGPKGSKREDRLFYWGKHNSDFVFDGKVRACI